MFGGPCVTFVVGIFSDSDAEPRGLNVRRWIPVAGIAALAATFAASVAAGSVTYQCRPLATTRSTLAAQQPGIMLPTSLPGGFVCPGPPLVQGLPSLYTASFVKGTRITYRGHPAVNIGAGAWDLQLNVWRGHVMAQVLHAMLLADAQNGSIQPFTAGRYAGSVELQHHAPPLPSFEGYVWQAANYTYLLGWRPGPGVSPRAIIASFR